MILWGVLQEIRLYGENIEISYVLTKSAILYSMFTCTFKTLQSILIHVLKKKFLQLL